MIQEISVSANSGGLGETLDDTTHLLTSAKSIASGIAVGPEGDVYVVSENLPSGRGVERLSIGGSNSLAKPAVTPVKKSEGESPGLIGGSPGENGHEDSGPQIAVAPEGGLVYAAQVKTGEEQELGSLTKEGNYEIRGMSTAEGELGAQRVVFGGGPGGASPKCHISSAANAIAAGKEGVLYALDEGEKGLNEVTEKFEPSSYGFRLVEFGPNGTGCPTPSASFTINGKSIESMPSVLKGASAMFDATGSELHNEEPVEAQWNVEGPDGLKEPTNVKQEKPGVPVSLKLEKLYLKPGRYTVTLQIVLKNDGSFGNPPPVTGTLTIEPTPPVANFEVFPSGAGGAPLQPGGSVNPGEEVTFNASESYDPSGSPSGKLTHTLKSYRWSFGDGTVAETTEPSYARSFANASPEARQETVSLTVVNAEGIESAEPATLTPPLTIQGTGIVKESVKEVGPKEQPKETVRSGPPPPLAKVVLTRKQKLEKALKLCKKEKPRRRRQSCEREANKKYGVKAKKKTAGGRH